MSDSEFQFPSPNYSTFTQAVRRYRPSQLLPLLASMSARVDPNFHGYADIRVFPPWAAAAIARESLVRGNEFRNADATADDIRRLARLHHTVFEEPSKPTLSAVIGPLIHEQMWWQIGLFEEWTRAVNLFEDTSFGDAYPWTDVIGLPISDAIRAAFVIGQDVNANGGRWDPGRLDLVYADPRLQPHIPRQHVEQLARYLTAPSAELRQQGKAYDERPDRDPDLEKYPLNPLMRYPLVDLGVVGTWAPVGPLVWRVLLPSTLYAEGVAIWGSSFTRSLGSRYQSYIGELLRNVAPGLLPEISYGKGGGSLSVDWIWVTDQAIVLVECKSAGLGIDARAGGGKFSELIDRYLVKGRRQIDTTAEQIRLRTPGFERIPNDKRVVGLVVTSEPFHFANAHLDEFGQKGTTPSMVVSARELEQLTSYEPDDAIGLLLEVLDDEERRTWNLEQALRSQPSGKHPAELRAWQRISPAWQDGASRS